MIFGIPEGLLIAILNFTSIVLNWLYERWKRAHIKVVTTSTTIYKKVKK